MTSVRVLLLSGSAPPKMSGAAVVVANLARQFSRGEMVLAGERPRGFASPDWRPEWPELVYVTEGWPPTLRGARWWRRLQFPLLVLRCVRLVRKRGCTAIVVVFPREEFLFAAYLTAVWTGARLFPYFHNTYVENSQGVGLRFARWLQDRVFRKAAHVFVMSAGMVELFRERYPGLSCSALVHSFEGAVRPFAPPPAPRSPMRLMMAGNFNESCREAATRVCQAVAEDRDLSLAILSATPRRELEQLGVLRQGIEHETPPALGPRLQEADILVLPHGFTGGYSAEEYRTIFPTRTLDYLLSGRPILAHTPADCFLTRFLRDEGCALIVDEASVAAVQGGIRRLRADGELRSRLVRNALRAAERFRAAAVAATLRARLHLG